MTESWTLKRMLEWGADFFAKNGVENPRLVMEQMLAHLLKKKRIELYVEFERALTEPQLAELKPMVQRRAKGEPLQYILGEAAFYDSVFKVSPAVLIPRPETELLVEKLLEEVGSRYSADEKLRFLDLGTGSGAIILSLSREFPQAESVAVDISEEALATARENAAAIGVDQRVQFLCGDWFAPVESLRYPKFHLIVSNPPYVSEKDHAGLAREVRDHEPRAALVAGPTGLEMYERIIPQAARFLHPGGLLAFEVGQGQADAVAGLLRGGSFTDISIASDLAGIPRIVLGIKT